jgi:hypothetical protein
MRKSYLVSAILAVAGIAMLATPLAANAKRVAAGSPAATSAKECNIVTDGSLNGENGPHRKFVVANNKAFISFTAKGKNCETTVALKSWYSPSRNGTPHEAQVKFQEKERTVGPGHYTMGIDLPAKGCFYQVDFVHVLQNRQPGQKNEMLGFTLNGDKDCTPNKPPKTPKTIQVCDLNSHQIVTINEKDFDASKYSKNLADCQTVPGELIVCRLSDHKIMKIKEGDFDASKYSKEAKDCEVTPPSTPKELPHTGASDVLNLVGAAALTGSTSYWVASRRRG